MLVKLPGRLFQLILCHLEVLLKIKVEATVEQSCQPDEEENISLPKHRNPAQDPSFQDDKAGHLWLNWQPKLLSPGETVDTQKPTQE